MICDSVAISFDQQLVSTIVLVLTPGIRLNTY